LFVGIDLIHIVGFLFNFAKDVDDCQEGSL